MKSLHGSSSTYTWGKLQGLPHFFVYLYHHIGKGSQRSLFAIRAIFGGDIDVAILSKEVELKEVSRKKLKEVCTIVQEVNRTTQLFLICQYADNSRFNGYLFLAAPKGNCGGCFG